MTGPMTGYPDDNRPAFRKAAALLRKQGFKVTSPDELDERDPAVGTTWADYLRRDIPWVLRAEMGVALPGWRESKGAQLEVLILTTLECPVFELIGEELRLVHPDRLPSVRVPI